MNKEIELAKSFFPLAQIFIILAGFLFATSGIAWANAQNTMNFGIDLVEKSASKNCLELNNISNYQEVIEEFFGYIGETVVSNLNLWKTYGKMGIIFVILSILTWIYGYWKLKRIKNSKLNS